MAINAIIASHCAVAHTAGQIQNYSRVQRLPLFSTPGTPQTFQSLLLICGEANRLPLRGEWHKPFSHGNVLIV
jgi:hypothetical protein